MCWRGEGGTCWEVYGFLLMFANYTDADAGDLPVQLKRRCETLQDRVLCSPLSPQYLLWKERTIRSAEATISDVNNRIKI